MSLPLVSCICPTYGRPPSHLHLLEEAIESFLRQTYPNKELIVLNDCPGQELVCHAPGVRVVNVPERFPSLGDKYNAAIHLALGALIAPWEDDDISLPWRLSLSVECLGDADYFNPQRYWSLDNAGLHYDHSMGYGHKLSLFTRKAFEAVGGYLALSGPPGTVMDAALRARVTWVGGGGGGQPALARSEWYYIDRWGASPGHVSDRGSPDDLDREDGTQSIQAGRFLLYPHWRRDYVAETRQLADATVSTDSVSLATGPLIPDTSPGSAETDQSSTARRAIVCFVEDNRHLIQQLLALRQSWLYVQSPDTDLVVMGPADALARLPDDLVKIEQRPAVDDPVWRGYRYVNSIACLNAAGAEQLDRYTHLLRSDVDTFITPAWNGFYPPTFVCGHGAYSNDDDIRQRLRRLAEDYGLVHRGLTNVGSTWYGPPSVVRRAAAFAEMLTKHLLMHDFRSDEGAWPGWYGGVALLYAGEVAVNHCAPDAQRSHLLDAHSTSKNPTADYPHIHCWHTDEKFSKHWFMSGRYTSADAQDLDPSIVRDYCMAMSFEMV